MRKTRPNSVGGYTLINPPPETVFEEGDRLLVISEDENSYKPGESRAPQNPRVVPNIEKHSKEVLKVLICGWKHDLKDVLMLLDNSVAKGSEVTILANTHIEDRLKELKSSASFHTLKVNHRHGDPLSKKALESLPLENYQKVIVLADQNRNSSHSATTTAMFVRHIQMQRGRKDAVIVAELPTSQDDAIQQVQKTWLNDSVQPEQLQAMVLAHLSEDSDVGAVLDEVISDYGSSLTLRSISTYAQPGEEFDFWELQARAQQLGDLVIAYKCAEDENRWMLNPEHKSKILSWTMTDEVLVLTRPKSTF
jgi:Trk K+ transport system NAD-binding subunit